MKRIKWSKAKWSKDELTILLLVRAKKKLIGHKSDSISHEKIRKRKNIFKLIEEYIFL